MISTHVFSHVTKTANPLRGVEIGVCGYVNVWMAAKSGSQSTHRRTMHFRHLRRSTTSLWRCGCPDGPRSVAWQARRPQRRRPITKRQPSAFLVERVSMTTSSRVISGVKSGFCLRIWSRIVVPFASPRALTNVALSD